MNTESNDSPAQTVNAVQLQISLRNAIEEVLAGESSDVRELYFVTALNCINDEWDHSKHAIPIIQMISDRIEKLSDSLILLDERE
jgi:hypothetical protein